MIKKEIIDVGIAVMAILSIMSFSFVVYLYVFYRKNSEKSDSADCQIIVPAVERDNIYAITQ